MKHLIKTIAVAAVAGLGLIACDAEAAIIDGSFAGTLTSGSYDTTGAFGSLTGTVSGTFSYDTSKLTQCTVTIGTCAYLVAAQPATFTATISKGTGTASFVGAFPNSTAEEITIKTTANGLGEEFAIVLWDAQYDQLTLTALGDNLFGSDANSANVDFSATTFTTGNGIASIYPGTQLRFTLTSLDVADPPRAVPEPATLALFGAGLLGLGVARRRAVV